MLNPSDCAKVSRAELSRNRHFLVALSIDNNNKKYEGVQVDATVWNLG